MNVELQAIKFNYDPILTNTGAINLRRNETQTVTVPEWRPDVCSNPECSPVAYTTLAMPAQMTIQALFSATAALWIRAVADPNHILGSIEPVPIPPGNSGYLTLELPHARVANAPVRINDIQWRWQFSTTPQVPDTWTDFQRTRHRIYTILSKPTCPWEAGSTDPRNIHQPWTEVLEHACQWATGAADQQHDLAATYITRRLFELGKTLVKYQGGPKYAHRNFDCSKFLELLAGGIGNGATVNCDDCATAVSTFANILGCDLSQSGMGEIFKTNRILLIGCSDWCNRSFIRHAVAWKGNCTATDAVFDACLQVDNDGHPDVSPEDPLQPTNLLFGRPSDKTYQFCLVDAASSCIPLPYDPQFGQQRRKLGDGYLGDVEITREEFLQILRRIYSFDTWPRLEESGSNATSTLELNARLLQRLSAFDWHVHSFEHTQDERFTNVVETILVRFNGTNRELLNINLYECPESSDWNDRFLKLLAMFQELNLKRVEVPRLGSVAFSNGIPSVVAFRRNRFLAVVRSVDMTSINVLDIAILVDAFLLAVNSSTTQAPQAKSKVDNRKGEKMRHRLSALKRSFRLHPDTGTPFAQEGNLDLSKMDANGVLADGTHFVMSTGRFFPITGEAFDIGNETFLKFRHTDGSGRFEGRVTYESGDVIIVSGKLFTPTFKTDDPTVLVQLEEPWVISKP